MSVLTAATCKAMRPEIEKALADVASKFGVKVEVGKMTYDPGVFLKVAVEFVKVDESGDSAKAVKEWNMFAPIYGLAGVPFGWTFTTHQGTFQICGVAPRASKFPVRVKNVADGKTYKFSEDAIRKMYDKNAKVAS